ncbi:MAG: hypothetical protein INQ03_06270 [Candidatus Heimdallarchaeota archaeon]|nr:hypothetical protein [Candidatus Heimdallarchaeota archaeon]
MSNILPLLLKILIIGSCGKKKKVSDSSEPTCNNLRTKRQRVNAIKIFEEKLTPARYLYTGRQATLISESIDLLRKNHHVDYYILSAGFGLVHEDDMLPPYDCSFNGDSKSKILARADQLGINEKLGQINEKYDQIFLIMGIKYLWTLELDIIENIGNKVVIFGHDKGLTEKYVNITTEMINAIDRSKLIIPLGNSISNKGSILYNFAYINQKDNISFEYWLDIINS